ncbi:hypothetical protein ACIA8E_41635 [Streptomyces sp. NPDC051664]|uniref:hypothetical protein n=1 Tax=Streptomyces sp. NPDC051664 TaxID=3365668 RepID=UPI0037AD2053
MPPISKKPLRPHQVETVDAVVRGLDIPPGKLIPRNGLRDTVVACGTKRPSSPRIPRRSAAFQEERSLFRLGGHHYSGGTVTPDIGPIGLYAGLDTDQGRAAVAARP